VINQSPDRDGTAYVRSQVIRSSRVGYRVSLKKGNAIWLRVHDSPHPRREFTTRAGFGEGIVGQSVDVRRNCNKVTGRPRHLNIGTRLIECHFDLGIALFGGVPQLEQKVLYLGNFPTESRSPIRIFLD
jgi:hypothetical protein